MNSLENYPVHHKIQVDWGEMDAYGHVNNAVYFRYIESARIAYFQRLDAPDFVSSQGVAPILANTSCQFYRPVKFPDTIDVGVRVKSIGASSLIMEYRLTSEKSDLVALAEAVIVCFDYQKETKALVPDNVKASIEKLEKQKF